MHVEDKSNTTTINWCCSVTCLTLLLSSPNKKIAPPGPTMNWFLPTSYAGEVVRIEGHESQEEDTSCFLDWLNRTVASRQITCPNYQIKELKIEQFLYGIPRNFYSWGRIGVSSLIYLIWIPRYDDFGITFGNLWSVFFMSIDFVVKSRKHKTELPSKRKKLEQSLLEILST
jgi:hypothetical protein